MKLRPVELLTCYSQLETNQGMVEERIEPIILKYYLGHLLGFS